MASLLRQIVAGPRARHPEAGLDLCYVTDNIIATSGPSQTYPQRAYRNPLDRLVAFLDSKHGDNWAIWEFRAEGTGYPDAEVYNRVRHYPFPDHHPPPFRLMPMILASMRNWLHGGDLEGGRVEQAERGQMTALDGVRDGVGQAVVLEDVERDELREKRVVVVHCKAGKGRSGTASTSYLIAEEGWKMEDALQRFTERRMRPNFGNGVSIPSQLRWISYVDRWTKGGKKYHDRPVDITEIHVWGLRNGVRVDVESFVDDGKKIQVYHTFRKEERVIIEATESQTALAEAEAEMASNGANRPLEEGQPTSSKAEPAPESMTTQMRRQGNSLVEMLSPPGTHTKIDKLRTRTFGDMSNSAPSSPVQDNEEPGGKAVVLRPAQPISIPHCDVNISIERRNKTHKSIGLAMVSAVAHVWFNTFFEGNGPEQDGKADTSGVFSIEWDAMDGIKGSSRKGTRALDRLEVVWRVADDRPTSGVQVKEPGADEQVPQVTPADWNGEKQEEMKEKDLGIRLTSPASADISRASSVKSGKDDDTAGVQTSGGQDDDGASFEGVKSVGPSGEDLIDEAKVNAPEAPK